MTTLMKSFDFEKPHQLNQLFDLISELKQNNQKYRFASGSTDLLPMFKKGIDLPDCLISLTALSELKGITLLEAQSSYQKNRIRIGATTRLSEIVSNPMINQYLPELARVAGLIANPQIRNQATIGGNLLVDNRCIYVNQSENNRACHDQCFKANGDLCHLVKSVKVGDDNLCQARFVSDSAPILILLDATLILQNKHNKRELPIKSFYKKDGIDNNKLKDDEILVAIEVPVNQPIAVHYEKLTIRKTLDFASVGVAVAIKNRHQHAAQKNGTEKLDAEKKIPLNKDNFEMEISLIGIQTLPGYIILSSQDFNSPDELLEQACLKAEEFSLIYQQDFFPRAYRRKMISVLIRRCFNQLMEAK